MVFLWFSFNSPWKPSTSPLLWNSPRDRETFAPRRCHRRTPFSRASPRDSPRQRLVVSSFNPSEKYESQLGWWHSQYMGKQKKIQTTNQKRYKKRPHQRFWRVLTLWPVKNWDKKTSDCDLATWNWNWDLMKIEIQPEKTMVLNTTTCAFYQPISRQTFFFHVGLVTFGCLMKQEKGEMLRLVVHPS